MTTKPRSYRRVDESLAAGTFVRMTLGKYRGAGDAHKVVATPVTLKDKPQLKFVTSHARQDVTQNFAIPGAITHMAALIGGDYLSATLFTTQDDLTLQFSKKKATTLSRAKPTFTAPPAPEHNRAKQYMVDPARPYLKALGVTQEGGIVKPSMYPKFKQICHFVEIVDQLISESELAAAPALARDRYRLGQRLSDVRALRSFDDEARQGCDRDRRRCPRRYGQALR